MARIQIDKDSTRKDVIIKAAAQLFREKGYKAASMRDLAEKVGVEAASLYNHIRSKTELLHDICFNVANAFWEHINLGRVAGVCELMVNGVSAGVQWYGRRVYRIGNLLKSGANVLEIKVTTSMGNYMKTLKDNGVAQKWTNEKRQDQPIQSMGLLGPVILY